MATTPNTNDLTYNDYVLQIATLAVLQTTTINNVVTPVDTEFNNLIPQMLNYAELRIQRDLDMLAGMATDFSYNLTTGANTLSVPVNDFQMVHTVSCVNGTAIVPLLPVSKEFLQTAYNDSATAYRAMPMYFAVYGGDTATGGNTSSNFLFGPYPDQAYAVKITAERWMPSLYLYATSGAAATGTTYISTNYPDMLVQASMVYLSQFQRNYLPTSNDPQMPGSFEAQYQTLLKSALEGENENKFRGSAWSSQSPSPFATPTR